MEGEKKYRTRAEMIRAIISNHIIRPAVECDNGLNALAHLRQKRIYPIISPVHYHESGYSRLLIEDGSYHKNSLFYPLYCV